MTNKTSIERGEELLADVPYSSELMGGKPSRMNHLTIPTSLLESFIAELKEAKQDASYQTDMACQCDVMLSKRLDELTTITAERDKANDHIHVLMGESNQDLEASQEQVKKYKSQDDYNNQKLTRCILQGESIQEQVKVLRAGLERLGSMEAFCVSCAIDRVDDELVARIVFAQKALATPEAGK